MKTSVFLSSIDQKELKDLLTSYSFPLWNHLQSLEKIPVDAANMVNVLVDFETQGLDNRKIQPEIIVDESSRKFQVHIDIMMLSDVLPLSDQEKDSFYDVFLGETLNITSLLDPEVLAQLKAL